YLSVGGDLEALGRLRDDVFRPPLERKLSWPWVPHVTLADGIAEERVAGALGALAGYAAVATIERVVLLEERSGRLWQALADADLGPPARVGTGGLALELTSGQLPDPEMPDPEVGPEVDPLGPAEDLSLLAPIVVTARREGAVVGWARAWVDRSGAHVEVRVKPECRRQGIGSHLLARVEALARQAGWEFPVLQADGPCGFYQARSRWAIS
ncbi:MAG: GNAT family N-acetyltransferase, partial [Acidimicrobiales bacterium]|nr:GNAT family N-acetyltransferase [Acidimicrobiales bacterium]